MGSKLLLLVCAGALGTLARYALSAWAQRIGPDAWPVGTLAVNTVGCLLTGAVFAILDHYDMVHSELRLVLLVGFMGAFTTFSALILESSEMFLASGWPSALLHLALQIALGFLALGVGWWALLRILQGLPPSP